MIVFWSRSLVMGSNLVGGGIFSPLNFKIHHFFAVVTLCFCFYSKIYCPYVSSQENLLLARIFSLFICITFVPTIAIISFRFLQVYDLSCEAAHFSFSSSIEARLNYAARQGSTKNACQKKKCLLNVFDMFPRKRCRWEVTSVFRRVRKKALCFFRKQAEKFVLRRLICSVFVSVSWSSEYRSRIPDGIEWCRMKF